MHMHTHMHTYAYMGSGLLLLYDNERPDSLVNPCETCENGPYTHEDFLLKLDVDRRIAVFFEFRRNALPTADARRHQRMLRPEFPHAVTRNQIQGSELPARAAARWQQSVADARPFAGRRIARRFPG